MIKTFALAALLGTALFTSAHAEEVTISRAMAAGGLHEGSLDMVAYWLDGPGDMLELTATFRNRATAEEPTRVLLPMLDGDTLAFEMPGYSGTLYSFARTGQEISISVETTPPQIAAR